MLEHGIDSDFICERIALLRTAKNISARDMSLSMGQGENYINIIENKRSLPSMQGFLNICEFLDIEPKDFFDKDLRSPYSQDKVAKALRSLKSEQLELVLALIKQFKD